MFIALTLSNLAKCGFVFVVPRDPLPELLSTTDNPRTLSHLLRGKYWQVSRMRSSATRAASAGTTNGIHFNLDGQVLQRRESPRADKGDFTYHIIPHYCFGELAGFEDVVYSCCNRRIDSANSKLPWLDPPWSWSAKNPTMQTLHRNPKAPLMT